MFAFQRKQTIYESFRSSHVDNIEILWLSISTTANRWKLYRWFCQHFTQDSNWDGWNNAWGTKCVRTISRVISLYAWIQNSAIYWYDAISDRSDRSVCVGENPRTWTIRRASDEGINGRVIFIHPLPPLLLISRNWGGVDAVSFSSFVILHWLHYTP